MMLQILHKIIAWIVALAVLLSSMSFTVAKHVCMGEVTEVSYFQEAKGCGMEAMPCDEEDKPGDNIKKQACCDSVHQLIPGEPAEQQAQKALELQQFDSAIVYYFTFDRFEEEPLKEFFLIDSGPPLVEYDILVQYQRFLI